MPLSLSDAASSSRRPASMAERGWKGFGSRRSTGTSWAPSAGALGGSGSGRSAESPFPSAFLFMSHHFLGQLQVGLGPAGADVVEEDRLSEARRLAQAHAARDGRLEDLVLEVP